MAFVCGCNEIVIRKMMDMQEEYMAMTKWLTNPEILIYYDGRDKTYNVNTVKNKYYPRIIGKDPVTPCMIEDKGQLIGYVQFYRIESKEYDKHNQLSLDHYKSPYGIDLFIGEVNYQNKGIGGKVINVLIQYLFETEGADVIFIDPQTWNSRAIKCYTKSGFSPVKVLTNRELHEGKLRDNLIMNITLEDYMQNNISQTE